MYLHCYLIVVKFPIFANFAICCTFFTVLSKICIKCKKTQIFEKCKINPVSQKKVIKYSFCASCLHSGKSIFFIYFFRIKFYFRYSRNDNNSNKDFEIIEVSPASGKKVWAYGYPYYLIAI